MSLLNFEWIRSQFLLHLLRDEMKKQPPRQPLTDWQWVGRASLTQGLDPVFSHLEPQFVQALSQVDSQEQLLWIKLINDYYIIQNVGLFIYTRGWFYPKITLGYHLLLVLLWKPNILISLSSCMHWQKEDEQARAYSGERI